MQKLLLFPLRLCVGWGLSPRLLSLLAATMLVLLRLSIGWHFYSEGMDKYQTGKWDATPFFANARGPFAEKYRQLVWDAEGDMRRDLEQTKFWWAVYRDRIGQHYRFDETQAGQAQNNYSLAVDRLIKVLEENASDFAEYDLGRQRMAKMRDDPSRSGVASLRDQRDSIRRDLVKQLNPLLSQIDAVWNNYESEQLALATPDQRREHGTLLMGKPRGISPMDTNVINTYVPYFDLAIGLCLLFGFFTPVAALAAAGFLGSVFLSQYPPTTGPTSSNYQLIECMACLVLASTGAGRFAGLDYFLHLIVRKVWGIPTDKG